MTEKDFRTYFRDLYPQLARYAARLWAIAMWTTCCKARFLSCGTGERIFWNQRMSSRLSIEASIRMH